jgi:hypothetical protein
MLFRLDGPINWLPGSHRLPELGARDPDLIAKDRPETARADRAGPIV